MVQKGCTNEAPPTIFQKILPSVPIDPSMLTVKGCIDIKYKNVSLVYSHSIIFYILSNISKWLNKANVDELDLEDAYFCIASTDQFMPMTGFLSMNLLSQNLLLYPLIHT